MINAGDFLVQRKREQQSPQKLESVSASQSLIPSFCYSLTLWLQFQSPSKEGLGMLAREANTEQAQEEDPTDIRRTWCPLCCHCQHRVPRGPNRKGGVRQEHHRFQNGDHAGSMPSRLEIRPSQDYRNRKGRSPVRNLATL